MTEQDERAICDAATTGDIEGAIELAFEYGPKFLTRDEAVDMVNDIVKRLYTGFFEDNQWWGK